MIAILLKARGYGHIGLVESNGKKAAFLRTVIASLSLPATVHAMRIENIRGPVLHPDIITARALTSLTGILDFMAFVADRRTIALIQKGRDYLRKLTQASAKWRFDLVKYNSVVNEDSVILEIRNLHTTGQG